ncbi:MAG: amino acid adenylation domain-containing protein [Xenococcaceae cyanobacterium MO_167.B27]|nr:amino acid adenylation domain-containing protein [Xenococcaceae cyanobacterium MO_167.B27]
MTNTMDKINLFPLSQIQQASYFLYQLEAEGLADKLAFALRIKGNIAHNKIISAFQELIDRCPSLRTRYIERDGKVAQEVVRDYSLSLSVVNGVDKELILDTIKQPFKLEEGEVIKGYLFQESVTDFVLVITVHQIACDEVSLYKLIDNFLASINAQSIKLKSAIPYQDYVEAENQLLNSNYQEQLSNYWQQELAGDLPILDLPSTLTAPVNRTYIGSHYSYRISSNLTQLIEQEAAKNNSSVNNWLLAAFKVLLYRYTAETDLLVGLAQCSKIEQDCVGNYVNVNVLRSSINEDVCFSEFLNQVTQQKKAIAYYKDYPFPLLVKQLQAKDNPNHSPICQAGFTYNNYNHLPNIFQLLATVATENKLTWGDLQLEYYPLTQHRVNFDLHLDITAVEDELLIKFNYNNRLLDSNTVIQFARHYQNLISEIITKPEVNISRLNFLSPREQKRLIKDWNNTAKDYNLSLGLHNHIEAQVKQTPSAVAVIFESQKLTYQQLNNRANQLAHYLQQLGVVAETKIGIFCDRSLEMVIGLLGILKAGGAYIPIDPNYPQERVTYLLADSQVKILLTQKKLQDKIPHHNAKTICLDSDWDVIKSHSEENPNADISPDNLAYIIYTSGSTGKPKGAMNTHRGICNRLLWMQEEYSLTPEDKVIQKTPFSFDVSVWEFFWTLMTGACLVVAKPGGHQDSNYLADLINQQQITTIHFVPSMLQIFVETAGVENCNSLRRVICSGEALPYELQQRFFSRIGCELHNLYGPTEAAIDVTYWKCQPDSIEKIVPIGRPIANIQIYILDKYLQPVPIGVAGELHIGGVGVARGYLNRTELTREKFIDNPFTNIGKLYKTGDSVRYLPDGNIEYLNRLDHQVKIRGFRIELGEIENTIASHPEIKEAVVIARTENSENKQLVAYLTLVQKNSNSILQTPTTLREYLQQQLPEYMIPSAFVILDAIPLTPNGKINRRALPKPNKSSYINNDFIAPRDRIQQKLADIWSELLDVNPIGIKDNFFELGGHSLLAMNLMSQISKHFEKNLPLVTLFTAPTIEKLAKAIQEDNQLTYSPLVPIQTQGDKEPFFCVHPAGGHLLCYVKLSQYLGKDQPFYGLQAQGFYEGDKALETVEDMARLYVKAIREFKPEGVYQVGGWSFGGVVAFEIAQQLKAQGQEVHLVILDSYMPIILDKQKEINDKYLVGVLSRVFGGMFGLDNLVTPEELADLSVEAQIDYIIDKARQVGIFPPEVEGQQNRRILDVLVGTLKATYSYKRRAYPDKVTVFRANSKHIMAPDPQLVWVELFSILDAPEVEIIDVPGNHYTFILDPHVKVLAEKLGKEL